MNRHRLELFVAVAEELHFNRAAQRLHMAQPPLSQQIRKLEDECRVRLFDRDTRSVQLTPAGRVLLTHAYKVLAQYDALDSAVQHARDGRSGTVRLGFVASAAVQAIPTLVQAIRADLPGVSLELHEMTTGPQIEAIGSGRLDLGMAREVSPTPGLDIFPLQHEPLILVVPAGHRLAEQPQVRLRDLRGEAFIAFPRREVSRLFDHIAGVLHSAGVEFRVAQEAVQFPTIIGLVAAHIGIAIVPACMHAFAIPGVRYLPIADPGAISTLCLIRQHAEPGPPALIDRITDTITHAPMAGPNPRSTTSEPPRS